MGRLIYLLNAMRLIQFIGGAGALACHIANIVILQENADNVGSWWDAKYLPYIFWFAADGFSVLCSFMLLIGACCGTKSVQADKSLSVINAAILAAAAIYATLKSQEPWTNGRLILEVRPIGWNTYCAIFNSQTDLIYRGLFLRCWLINGVWLGTLFTCLTWLIGGILVWSKQRYDFFGDDYRDNDYSTEAPPLPPVSAPAAATTNISHDHNNNPPHMTAAATPTSYKSYNTTTTQVPGRNNNNYNPTPYSPRQNYDGPRYTTSSDSGGKYAADEDNYYDATPNQTAPTTSNAAYATTAAGYGGGYNNTQYSNSGYSNTQYNNARTAGGGGGYAPYNSSTAQYSARPQQPARYSGNVNYGRSPYN
ncbi:hypothetical protein BC936DRAFT_147736 [Jimgerdemannia flammicorona]|uniref:Uncharacterized protein n=1 Tax=Jimgerdemannia flammicorona TaxID=994334 RepID=A0A433D4N0_9FUNG|nr:hypothetical protein BC936DRAFT_147736 [Jimgerdemannia flammicorona]